MDLYHFSDQGDIALFEPRSPLKHPDTEPLVYAIDEWHSALYLFPRDCPRIGLWAVENTTAEDKASLESRMHLMVDRSYEHMWREGTIYRYTFDSEGFIDCHDHGVWVNRSLVKPTRLELIDNLPEEAERSGAKVEVVDSLARVGRGLFDRATNQFTTTLHVSMVRMSLLPDWDRPPGQPVTPK